MLDQRLARLTAGDLTGYLAPLDPGARQTESAIAQGFRAAPIEGLKFSIQPASVPSRADAINDVRVDLSYRYTGLPPDNAFRIGLSYNLARRADGWAITSSALRPGALLPVWATGPIGIQRSQNFLVLYRPGLQNPARVMQEAEAARSQLDGKITFPLESSYLLLIAQDDAEYRSMSSAALAPVSPIAQVETSYEVNPTSIRVLGRQILVNDLRLQEEGSALETFRHELGHLALAQYTRPFTPAWVSESAAMYLAGTRPVSIWRQGLSQDKFNTVNIDLLTRAANLGEYDTSREGTSLKYAYSAAAAWYLAETFGPERFFNFYRSYADVAPLQLYERLPEQTASAEGARAIEDLAVSSTAGGLQRIFGLDPATLDQRVREWMAVQK